MIAHWPESIKKQAGKFNRQPTCLIDIAPTLYDISGADYPKAFHESQHIHQMEGINLLSRFEIGKGDTYEYMFWEHQNNIAIRQEKWKAIKAVDETEWQLYNIEQDRIESKNVAQDHPELVKELNDKWYEWANAKNVLPKQVKKNL